MNGSLQQQFLSRLRCFFLANNPESFDAYLEEEDACLEVCQGLVDVLTKEDLYALDEDFTTNLKEFLSKVRAKYQNKDLIECVNELIRSSNTWDHLDDTEKELRSLEYMYKVFLNHGDNRTRGFKSMFIEDCWDYFVMDAAILADFDEGRISDSKEVIFPYLGATTYYLLSQGYFKEDNKELLNRVKETLLQKSNRNHLNKKMLKKIEEA